MNRDFPDSLMLTTAAGVFDNSITVSGELQALPGVQEGGKAAAPGRLDCRLGQFAPICSV